MAVINGKEYSADLAEYSEGRGNPNLTVISESGLYRILAKCNLPKCEPFESWVFDEVLPSIRKTGSYGMTQISRKDQLFLDIIHAESESDIPNPLRNQGVSFSVVLVEVHTFRLCYKHSCQEGHEVKRPKDLKTFFSKKLHNPLTLLVM